MESTVASFHLNVISHSILVPRGCTWRIRFLLDTKQKYSQSSLTTTLYAKIAFQSKAEKNASSSVLGLTTDYHSISAETKKFSLLPLEVTPSLPFVLPHTHLQRVILSPRQFWLSQLLARVLPAPSVFTAQRDLFGLKPLGLWIYGLRCHFYVQHPKWGKWSCSSYIIRPTGSPDKSPGCIIHSNEGALKTTHCQVWHGFIHQPEVIYLFICHGLSISKGYNH